MKYSNLNEVYQKEFNFLVTDYNFDQKGNFFIRILNKQIIQTVNLLVFKPFFINIGIGFYSVYNLANEIDLTEGNRRLGDFLPNYNDWDLTKYLEEEAINVMKKTFKTEVCPYLNRMNTIEEFLEVKKEFEHKRKRDYFKIIKEEDEYFLNSLNDETLKRAYKLFPKLESIITQEELQNFKKSFPANYGGIFTDMVESYIKIGDLESAYKALDFNEKATLPLFNYSTYDPERNEENNHYFYNDIIDIYNKKKSIKNKDIVFLNEIVKKAENKTRDILVKVGIDL